MNGPRLVDETGEDFGPADDTHSEAMHRAFDHGDPSGWFLVDAMGVVRDESEGYVVVKVTIED